MASRQRKRGRAGRQGGEGGEEKDTVRSDGNVGKEYISYEDTPSEHARGRKAGGRNERCKHRRPRSACKDCRGGGICEHGRVRSQCKDCRGGSICEHGRVRSQCKDCGGGSICEHGR
eukprot:766703-Hanusia_phi.AAC.3